MFEDKAKRFVDKIETRGRFDEGEFVSNLQSEIYPFKDRDKLSLLSDIQTRIISEKEAHEKVCPRPIEECPKSKTYSKTLVFVRQELTDLGDLVDEPTHFPNGNSTSQTQSDFSTSQLVELHTKIDDVLYQLKLMGLGHEIIYQEIEELKNDTGRVTKKDLGLMVIGKVVEFGSAEVSQIPEVQELYRYIANTVKGLPPFNL